MNKKLLIASMDGIADKVNLLLDEGADVNFQDNHGRTPLNIASENGRIDIVNLLLDRGADINVKDKYDHETAAELFNVVDELQNLSQGNFDLKYLMSYDDQGFDLEAPLDTTFVKMNDFKDNLMTRKNYLYHNNHPLFFSFDYPSKFLSAQSFRTVIDSVFQTNKPYLIWNTFGEGEEVESFVDSFYPWVQPGGEWDAEGMNWGEDYLKYFYNQVNTFETKYDFVTGGVWAGFDDRKNTSWGGNRLISRQNGKVYDNTWYFIHNYNGELPMRYVVLETWNDWNEGTEIQPSVEHGYQYLVQTIKNVNQLKGSDIPENQVRFEMVKEIHDAIKSNGDELSDAIKVSIQKFCAKENQNNLKISNISFKTLLIIGLEIEF